MPLRVFFLSAGRCGTQWITHAFNTLYGDIIATHEPLIGGYKCRESYLNPGFVPVEVMNHFARIGIVACQSIYLETAWQFFTAVDYADSMFSDQLRVIHLVRSRDDVARSMVTHRFYTNRKIDAFSSYCVLDPVTDNYLIPAGDWLAKTQFERCQWLWTEINNYSEQVVSRLGDRAMSVSYEEIFNGDGFDTICNWLGLEYRDVTDIKKRKVDKHAVI
jgi:hypothetical protein